MEHCVNVVHVAKHHTVNSCEWYRIQENIETVRTVVYQRVSELDGNVLVSLNL